MNRSFHWGKLKLKLIGCLVLSFALSLGLFLVLQATGEDILERYFTKTSFIERQEAQAFADFQEYVAEQKLSVEDRGKIGKWVRDRKYVIVYLYLDKTLLYATDGNTFTTEDKRFLPHSLFRSNPPLVPVAFTDATVQLYMESYFEYKYSLIITILGVVISFLFFVGVMLFFINKKTSYIGTLEKEIKILEGGDLTYTLTRQGNDELASLAESINEMRLSFMERLENENQARMANSELVTAMSHDLRTPLTALVGYLDIIAYKKYQTNEDVTKYIESSREKAYQIKHLSDKLFEYFTVSGTEDSHLELERYDGIALLDQLIDEQLFVLENNGFTYEWEPGRTPFQLEVHLISFRRVFDNLFANILKYADKAEPILIGYSVTNGKVEIELANTVSRNPLSAESTGIGMKTCQSIIEQHNGTLTVTRQKDSYAVRITMNVQEAPHEHH